MISCETLDLFANRQWVLLTDFFSEPELHFLRAEAQRKWLQGEFAPAKVGRSQDQQVAHQIRSDWTSWLDLQAPGLEFFAARIEELRLQFNQNFYWGLRQFEGHFARYAEGQFYDEHLDQSPRSSPLHGERRVSFVLYLNEYWQPEDGGELSLRLPEQAETRVEPRWGHLVLFRSDTVPHAVLPAQRERWSLTGWFRRS